MNKKDNNLDKEVLIELYKLHSEQAYNYDKSNISLSISTFTILGTVSVIFNNYLLNYSESDNAIENIKTDILLLLLICVILGIIAFFLYSFSMNCRKVALTRSYLKFIEEKIDKNYSQKCTLYNRVIDGIYLDKFVINKFSPILLSIIFIIFYWFTLHTYCNLVCKILSSSSFYTKGLVFLSISVVLVFLLYSILSLISLFLNNRIQISITNTLKEIEQNDHNNDAISKISKML